MRSTLDEETSGDFERVSEGKGAKHIKKNYIFAKGTSCAERRVLSEGPRK